MIGLLFAWLGWTALSIALGVVIGLSIAEADRRERLTEVRTSRLDVSA